MNSEEWKQKKLQDRNKQPRGRVYKLDEVMVGQVFKTRKGEYVKTKSGSIKKVN